MNTELIFALSRSIERLGIIGVAGLSIWAGFRLFSIVTEAQASGRLEGQGFKFAMKNVGPGVFFALFGAMVLLYALASPLQLAERKTASDGTSDGVITYGLSSQDKPSYKGAIAAINRIDLLADQAGTASLSEHELKQLVSVSDSLPVLREWTREKGTDLFLYMA